MTTKLDAIIIGTGQAGPALSVRLAQSGMKVAIIERKRFGGTCVNNGCIPTKTLVASARTAYIARRAADFGVLIDSPIRVDMAQVKARKDRIVHESNTGVESWLKNTPNLSVYQGHARFEDAHTVSVNDVKLQADKMFINVGGRAIVPPGFQNTPHFTNSSIMDVDFLPDHLIVVGGSYIGLEFGQMYRRFGSNVTIVHRGPRLIEREDPDISDAIKSILESEGIVVHLAAECVQAKQHGTQVAVSVNGASGTHQILGSHILLAVGRKPNTDDLGLETTGIQCNPQGYILVDDHLRTNIEGVWALGDCNGKGAFTHTSWNDHEIVADNLLDNDPRKVSDRILAYNLYIDPPLGRVGMTEAQVRQLGRKVLMGRRPMSRIGRAVEKGETQGFMKILIDAESKQILGASLLGVECDEVIHSLIDIMYAKAPYTVIQRAMHIHPTVSELIPTILSELQPLT